MRRLYRTTRPELAALDGIFELQLRAQARDWEARFPDSTHDVILADDEPVGRVWVAWSEDECRIVDLALVPERRRAGLGTRIVEEILAEADERRLLVRLSVARTNAAAHAFWSKLGFKAVDGDAVYVAYERASSG